MTSWTHTTTEKVIKCPTSRCGKENTHKNLIIKWSSVQDPPKHSGQSIAKNILLEEDIEEDIEEEDIEEEDIEAAEAKSKMRLQEDLVILKR